MAARPRKYKRAGLSDNIVNLEGLVHDGEPFRAGGRAPFSILRQRQLQGIKNPNDFFSRCQMRKVWPRAECFLIKIIKRGQSSREKFPVDNAFSKAFDAPKAHPF